MKLINNSKNNLSHDIYYLAIGETLDVPNDIAKLWLSFDGINQYFDAEYIEAEKEKAVKEALKTVESKPKAKAKKK